MTKHLYRIFLSDWNNNLNYVIVYEFQFSTYYQIRKQLVYLNWNSKKSKIKKSFNNVWWHKNGRNFGIVLLFWFSWVPKKHTDCCKASAVSDFNLSGSNDKICNDPPGYWLVIHSREEFALDCIKLINNSLTSIYHLISTLVL